MGMLYRMSGIFSAFFVLSHSFPKAWYKEKAFQQQRKYLFAVFMAEEGIHMAYFGLELAFVHVPSTYQWILALLLIPMQEMLTRSYSWLCDKALGYEDVSSELVASNFVMTFQAMFMSIVLGTSATPASSYILFIVAVLQFLVDTLKVVEHIAILYLFFTLDIEYNQVHTLRWFATRRRWTWTVSPTTCRPWC